MSKFGVVTPREGKKKYTQLLIPGIPAPQRGKVWMPAAVLYDLRVAAGLRPKKPKRWGDIVWIRRDKLAALRRKTR